MREARALGIFFWIRSEIGYQKPHITPLFSDIQAIAVFRHSSYDIKAIGVQQCFYVSNFCKKKTSNNNKVNYTPVSKNQNKE